MKSFLYVGGALMIGATIYGFVDYKKASHSNEFRSLYHETEITEPAAKVAEPVESKTISQPVAAEVKTEVKKEPEKTVRKSAGTAAREIKKNKKLNYKSFSRAPLREFTPPEVSEIPNPKKLKTDKVEAVNL